MKQFVISCFILFSAEAQRRPGPCSNGGRPVCADRSRPMPQFRKPPLCNNGASPVCSDGNPPPRPGPCEGGGQPMCGSAQPVCADGSALSDFGRPCTRGAPICQDRSKRPSCVSNNRPINGGNQSGGRPFGGPPGGRPSGGRPLGGGAAGNRPFGSPSGGNPAGSPSGTTGSGQQQGTPETGYETSIKIRQTWDQEPSGFDREALVKVPPTSTGKKWPLVIDLHGAGGSANLRRLRDISDSFVIVAASGYNRFWNVYSENSQADDVDFLLKLIKKVGEDVPEADMEDVTIVGTSNGAGMIYRLLMETRNPRPFKRVIPLVSSLINIQYHDNSFWLEDQTTEQWNVPTVPDKPGPQIIHFHGTEDGTVPYLGGGGNFLGEEVDFLDAQDSDFVWAKAFGYTGPKLADSAGTEVETGVVKYEYLGGQVVHFKMVGMGHGALGSQYKQFIMNTIRNSA